MKNKFDRMRIHTKLYTQVPKSDGRPAKLNIAGRIGFSLLGLLARWMIQRMIMDRKARWRSDYFIHSDCLKNCELPVQRHRVVNNWSNLVFCALPNTNKPNVQKKTALNIQKIERVVWFCFSIGSYHKDLINMMTR